MAAYFNLQLNILTVLDKRQMQANRVIYNFLVVLAIRFLYNNNVLYTLNFMFAAEFILQSFTLSPNSNLHAIIYLFLQLFK